MFSFLFFNQPCCQPLKSRTQSTEGQRVCYFTTFLLKQLGGKSKLSQHISLPLIKMLRAETFAKGLLSRAPGNRYNFIVETKGVMPLINRHLFQKISPGEVGSSHLPIFTMLRPVSVTALRGCGQQAYGFSHITLERILTAQGGKLWDVSQAKY